MMRNRDRYPAIPFIMLWDDDGAQNFDSVGAFHTWDIQEIQTSHFQYDPDNDRIYLNRISAGYYEITFECSFDTDYGGVVIFTSQLYKNGTAVNGAKTTSTAAGGQYPHYASQSLHHIIYLERGDYIQIETKSTAQSVDSIAETSRLLVKFIPVHGWNNSNAGRIDYRGEVLR